MAVALMWRCGACPTVPSHGAWAAAVPLMAVALLWLLDGSVPIQHHINGPRRL